MPFIVETIVTTVDKQGEANFAPMGVVIEPDEILIRPYKDTATYRNLLMTGQAVMNITDNVLLFAESAVSSPQFPAFPAEKVRGLILKDACSYYECVVKSIEMSGERAEFTCEIVKKGFLREFIGFNRAKNAIIEAAILATRIRFLGKEKILEDYTRFQEIVKKTGGDQEKQAMAFLVEYIKGAALSKCEGEPKGQRSEGCCHNPFQASLWLD